MRSATGWRSPTRSTSRACTSTRRTSTAKAEPTPRSWTSSSGGATTSFGGDSATCTSAVLPPSSSGRTERLPQPATRAAVGTASSSVRDGVVIRPAQPRDAGRLVALAEEVAAEPEAWLISDGGWRTAADERRYLRALRNYR